MRKIKFRAWDAEEHVLINDIAQTDQEVIGTWEILKLNHYYEFPLMQFTGLCDKNGKEIYEDDILKYDGERCPHCKKLFYDKHNFYRIVWVKEDACFECINGDNFMSANIWNKAMQIIGNVYENPELLKEVKDAR